MWLYILIFILVAILVLPDMRSGELSRFKLGIFFFLFLLLWVFAGFRDGVGPDWNTYERIFREDLTLGQILSGQGTAVTRVEPFFLLFCYLVKLPGGNIHAFYILFNLLSIALVFLAIRKYGVYALAGILVYMAHGYLMNFSQIRQGLAAAIFFFALHFFIHRRYLLYAGLILVAMLFHYSVLITVPLIFFSRYAADSPRKLYWILGVLVAAILIRQLHMLPRLIMLMADITGNPVFERYVTGYLEDSKFSYSIGITPLMIEWACWLTALFIYRKKLNEQFPHFNVFFNLCWMGLGVYIIATDIAVLSRLAIYFRMTFIVLLPILLSLLLTPGRRGYRVALFCLLIGISFVRWYTPVKEVAENESIPNNFVPYKTILLHRGSPATTPASDRSQSYDTISNYIGYLTDAFLVHKVERYNIKGKETISGNAKYYINDLSFKNFLYPGFDYGFGYKLENLVYLELRRAGYQVYVGTLGDKEVDFVATKGERRIYVQSAYLLSDEQTVRREYAPLEAIRDNYEKFVVSLDDIALPLNRGIRHIQAWSLAGVL